MNRKIFYWKLRSVELHLGEKTLIMGILNVTPDSFSDGGKYCDPERAYERALELEEQGADIIDIGAESTSPGSSRVSAEEEWRRLGPVLKKLRDKLTIPISLDTYKAEVAERALGLGVEIINDPSGLTFDADLAKTVANANAGLILNHMRGTPETWAKLPPLPDMMGSVVRDLEATINRARRAGVDRARIAIDPGLGFGKRREQNSEILAQLRMLSPLECPVLIGPSRKSFLAQAIAAETGDPGTVYATAAAVAISILNGAHIVRVHDVKEMRAVAQIADEVARVADEKEAKAAAAVVAERAVPRRSARELDERPRSVKPPLAKPAAAPAVEKSETPIDEPPVPVEEPAVDAPDESDFEAIEIVGDEAEEAPRRDVRKEVRKETRPAAKPYADRPPKRDFAAKPPRRDFGDKPPRRDGGGPPRRDFGDKPLRRDGGGPPRRDFGDRPPRRDFGGKPSGPPRKDFGSTRPPSGDRPPRRDFGDRPPRRDFGGKPSGPPRKDFGSNRPPSADRPPRRDSGDRPPRRDFGGKPSGPPRGKGPGGGGPRPQSRPFRKRP